MSVKEQENHNRIPISVALNSALIQQDLAPVRSDDKSRLLYISCLAIVVAILISGAARCLVWLINALTQLFFHGQLSLAASSPAGHSYGIWVIFIPALGGIAVGLMALYGSKAIRGHGIPEAMEQILTNESRIRPSITYLKPISSAISIGTGGPFGAEGPIIATGGALGSTLGQLLRISPYERKILLASGATAGMSAIFGTPIAAIFLAIELLLFEFSPRSILPVALACITGAAGHHLLFESGPVFMMPAVAMPSNTALAIYSGMGLLLGLAAALITKAVYWIEDAFEQLPIHWMWWPALGGLGVGIVGYFAPRTLGVGYENITQLLSGHTALSVVLCLCFLKFLSWAVALGSGTSGGTLAPLLTIGGAAGILLGMGILAYYPQSGIVLPLAALVGMSALFAGASRALLTSILFAIETTDQANALLPLLAACLASYLVSYLLMKNTIMTEKIARRGVVTPHSYEPDRLHTIKVKEVLKEDALVLSDEATLREVRTWLQKNRSYQQNFYVVANEEGQFKGVISSSSLYSLHHSEDQLLGQLIKRPPVALTAEDSLKTAVEIMARENLDVLPVRSEDRGQVLGVLTYRDILSVYRRLADEHQQNVTISLRRRTLKMLLHGRKRLASVRNKVS
ncbi:MAG TPA: chloride channel protein [Flavisolibacter sp.]|jgi:H+/Cl- antiporter ClcA|nr:chloride channel protein [Flavisolibacter sp.]